MEGLTIRLNQPKRQILKPIIVLVITISLVILSLPSMIIVLFSNGHETDVTSESTIINEQLDSDSAVMVNVERTATNQIESVPLEQYVVSVVASEMPAEFAAEALKAQALAARTYIIQYMLALDSLQTEEAISDTVQHQVYRNDDELKELWGSDYSWKIEKITEAVFATANQVLIYDDYPITPAFFSTSNGATENAEDYWENALPYLVSVDSPWDLDSPKYLNQKTIPISEVEQLLDITLAGALGEPLMTYTESDRVKTVELSGKIFTGREIREKLDLRSADFSIKQKDDHLIFTTKGFGHGVGMSQYGANGMAEEGKDYQEIVAHYYPGVEISVIDQTDDAYFVFGKQDSDDLEIKME